MNEIDVSTVSAPLFWGSILAAAISLIVQALKRAVLPGLTGWVAVIVVTVLGAATAVGLHLEANGIPQDAAGWGNLAGAAVMSVFASFGVHQRFLQRKQ